ncbi:hypothetical protein WOLCODRAFT_141864 [Wolfiporia cocos MD-104 SS10]|uniref:Uncharacterized protein n=1 Tax=Wolfiporia cocos (strain MD-104) TaxID=742152 RepID=A0A2H3JD81_WOLCO|nr:hypothetical protein WOLCODRAFT_141864 [Wolfiporia cocos MD-104 SS10]
MVDYVYVEHLPPRHALPRDPPPPYEPLSIALPSPLPTPTFPTHSAAAGRAPSSAQRTRPLPQALLHDPAFSNDPHSNPYFVMTSHEHIHAAHPPPRDGSSSRQPPPGISQGRADPPAQRPLARNTPYVPPPRGSSRDAGPMQRPFPPAISASSVHGPYAMWRPPALSTASSDDSDYSDSEHSSPVQHTRESTPPSSVDSSPRHSTVSSVPSSSSDRDKPTPPVPTLVVAAETPAETVPTRILAPPRSSSLPSSGSQTPAQPPVPAPAPAPNANAAPASDVPSVTPRPVPTGQNKSALELHVRPPPPQTLSRSATAPTRALPTPPQSQTQGHTRSQSQPQAQAPEQSRGRSREQQPVHRTPRQRSRRPSVSAPRDLDRIDELDESDPRGLAWHHGGPYEAIRSVSQPRRKEPPGMEGVGAASTHTRRAQSVEREKPRLQKKPSMSSFSVQPGEIFPSNAMYKAMPGSFDPYSAADSTLQYPGAPPLPPAVPPKPSSQPQSRPQTALPQSSRDPVQAQVQNRPSTAPPNQNQPQQQTRAPPQRVPVPSTSASSKSQSQSTPLRPPLLQNPSQRSGQVRFESPSRPDVRPPLGQGSVDVAFDSREMNAAPPPSPGPHRQPLAPIQAQANTPPPPPPQKHSRHASTYLNVNTTPTGSAESLARATRTAIPRSDISMPPRGGPTNAHMQALPPRHRPTHLVMPAPLQPLEDERRRQGQSQVQPQSQVRAAPQSGSGLQLNLSGRVSRSEDGHGGDAPASSQRGRHLLHRASSFTRQSQGQAGAVQVQRHGRSRSQSQTRSEAVAPKVLRKRPTVTRGHPHGTESSSTSAAIFASRVVDRAGPGSDKGRVVEHVQVWPRDRVKEAELQREMSSHNAFGRKLSKLRRH